MASRFHLLAIPGTFAATALCMVAAIRGLELLVAWMSRLPAGEQAACRLLCLAVPAVLLPLAVALRRRRRRRVAADSPE